MHTHKNVGCTVNFVQSQWTLDTNFVLPAMPSFCIKFNSIVQQGSYKISTINHQEDLDQWNQDCNEVTIDDDVAICHHRRRAASRALQKSVELLLVVDDDVTDGRDRASRPILNSIVPLEKKWSLISVKKRVRLNFKEKNPSRAHE